MSTAEPSANVNSGSPVNPGQAPGPPIGPDQPGAPAKPPQVLTRRIQILVHDFSPGRLPCRRATCPTVPDIRVTAHLSASIPIVAEAGQERIEIGTREEFLHRRLAIQEGLQRLHQYSARLIAICLRHSAGLLVLHGQSEKEARAQENEFLLRNWSYHGLKEKISYKAAKYGIKVLIE